VSGFRFAETAAAVADRSDLARLLGTGPDLLSLLHRLSTADLKDLHEGEGCPTVLTSAKGRIVERLFVHHFGVDGVLMLAGPDAATRVVDHLKKFTFAEQTGITNQTAATFAHALLGPRWPQAAAQAGITPPPPYGAARSMVAGVPVRIAGTNGFDAGGLIVIGDSSAAAGVYEALERAAASVGGGAIDAASLEAWRILRSLPAPGHELTGDRNPLEAGLRDAVSFTKGCYVGQEVVARLNTYDKVSRSVVRLDLPPGAPVPAIGAAVKHADRIVGEVTSAIHPEGRPHAVALAYVKLREIPAGASSVVIEDTGRAVSATIVRDYNNAVR
jgi:folate-binding protein YgfZ